MRPLAQSSELPPPSAMMESIRCGTAKRAPAATMSLSGFSPKAEYRTTVSEAAWSDRSMAAAWPAATIPGSATSRIR